MVIRYSIVIISYYVPKIFFYFQQFKLKTNSQDLK